MGKVVLEICHMVVLHCIKTINYSSASTKVNQEASHNFAGIDARNFLI